jgi:hypothetical protein
MRVAVGRFELPAKQADAVEVRAGEPSPRLVRTRQPAGARRPRRAFPVRRLIGVRPTAFWGRREGDLTFVEQRRTGIASHSPR